ncbi:HlyD family secretion protein [Tellurirhabdus rosea]|uniref:HlyD family secretion protein n=1 Tax=Tellurirhabdus rosea TaxID=2674997 RepID=UPI002259EBB6|nr:HlyD family efflux transporter periplasmic adaptor subunit [Tellurirhabdus rosea]
MTPTLPELRSEEVHEILSRPPAWPLRWGITMVFAVVALLFTAAWVIRYPDLVKSSFRLTSVNAPKPVLARSEGRLVRLFARERLDVQAGTGLAWLENTADHAQLLRLEKVLINLQRTTRRGNLEPLRHLNLTTFHSLGEVQAAFQTFEKTHIELQAYLSNGFYARKRTLLQQEIRDLQALAQNLREQQAIQAQDMRLAQEDFDIQQSLARQKVIAPLDLKREESKNLSRKLPYQQTLSALINNETAQRAKQKEILELDKLVDEQRAAFIQALHTLQSTVESWKARYVVTAPMAGRVHFSVLLQEGHPVRNGEELFYIAPNSTAYYGELRVPQVNFGKVKIGQQVLVKFAGYPYAEFGAVRGRITAIAEVPLKDSVFLAKVALPNGLETTFHRRIPFKTGLSATAEIQTDNSRLLEKLAYQLREVLTR